MLTKQSTTTRVHISQKYLCKDLISDAVYDAVYAKLVGKCTKKNGYIMAIESITDLREIFRNHNLIYEVKCVISVFLPKEGLICDGKVCWISNGGLLVNVLGLQKVLIQENNLNGFKFEQGKNRYIKDDIIIELESDIKIVISIAELKNEEFMCFGNLVENKKE